MRRIFKLLPTSYQARVRALVRFYAAKRGFLRYQNWESGTEGGPLAGSAYAKSATDSSNPLQTYFESHTEGRGIWKLMHYFEIYHRHFSKFIGQEVHVLEIGVYSGGSLEMWKHYFGSECRIYGVDIQEECKAYADDSVKIFVGDQADRNFWTLFKKEVPFLDVIIDDGGHMFEQQMATLEEMLPHLRPGGVYLCEDVVGDTNPFAGYISGLSRNLNAFRPWDADGRIPPTQFQRDIHSVHLYPYVAVIEKTESPVNELFAPKQGTQWQPFL